MVNYKTKKFRKRGGIGTKVSPIISATIVSNKPIKGNKIIPSENIIDNSIDAVKAVPKPLVGSVLATTRKNVPLRHKMWNGIKKITGFNNKVSEEEQSIPIINEIDFNLNWIKGTCLDNETLNVKEIGAINDGLAQSFNKEATFKRNIKQFCNVRNILRQLDNNIDINYPSLYKFLLTTSFSHYHIFKAFLGMAKIYKHNKEELYAYLNTKDEEYKEIMEQTTDENERFEDFANSILDDAEEYRASIGERISSRNIGGKKNKSYKLKRKNNKSIKRNTKRNTNKYIKIN